MVKKKKRDVYRKSGKKKHRKSTKDLLGGAVHVAIGVQALKVL